MTMSGLETVLTDEGTESNPIIEVEITPNRADCLSAKGVAREIATLFDLKLKDQAVALSERGDSISDYISVGIDNIKRCPQYSARMICGVKIAPSPAWLADLLTSAGLRPINNVVDIANFILLDEGQPLHAFDYDRVGSKKIVVRTAKEGEKFTTLDEKERILTADDLLITNGDKGLALAGIMGGLKSEVEDDTTNILLESAYFESIAIRKTSRRIGLKTDSSHRFGHGVDPQQVSRSLDRAAAMIADLAGGKICKGISEVKGEYPPLRKINIRAAKVKAILGIGIGVDGISAIMDKLRFDFKVNKDSLDVAIPSYCTDIDREIDLIEEVARLYGYNNIPNDTPRIPTVAPKVPKRIGLENNLRSLLSGVGLSEAINYSFIGDELDEVTKDTIEVRNPINKEMAFMRRSLIPSLLNNVRMNINKGNHEVSLFEIGRNYSGQEGNITEEPLLSVVLTAYIDKNLWRKQNRDFYDIKGIAESILSMAKVSDYSFEGGNGERFHPGKCAKIVASGQVIAEFGEIHPTLVKKLDLPLPVLAMEMNLNKLLAGVGAESVYKPMSKFPTAIRDIAFLLDEKVTASDVEKTIKEVGGEKLKKIVFFDEYRGKQIGEGKKSLACNLIFESEEGTLAEEEIDSLFKGIIASVEKNLGGTLR